MQVIPVIDLKGGQAVGAEGGRRDSYRPIKSPLCAGSSPDAVARGYLSLHDFSALYVADLDGIEGRGRADADIARIVAAAPDAAIWVDNGLAREADARAWLAANRGCLVLGAESQADARTVAALAESSLADRVILSLDFREGGFIGPDDLWESPAVWPGRVIVMTLARVGARGGPDMARIAEVRARAGGRAVYAAGGVRDAADLAALQAAGVAGALVATALHDGRLDAAALRDLATPVPEGGR